MRIRIPSRRVRERFFTTYELRGAQRGIDVLASYYRVRRMKIVLDGRKVSKKYDAEYFENKAYFTRMGLTKRTVLHEFYHHLVDTRGWDLPSGKEEKGANRYAREFLGNRYS